MRGTAIAIAAAFAMALAACGGEQQQAAAPATPQDTYIHVDPATGCHYIVFPGGDGIVRERPEGTPYCETAQQPAGQ